MNFDLICFLERFILSRSTENFDDIPYYFQPMFAIPIITAIVVVFIVVIITYVCVQKIKARYEAADFCACKFDIFFFEAVFYR